MKRQTPKLKCCRESISKISHAIFLGGLLFVAMALPAFVYSEDGLRTVLERFQVEQEAGIDIVTGRVVNEKGEALEGVSVQVKGATTGAFTGADGLYSVAIADGNAVLVFSFVGYSPEEISVNGRSTVDAVLRLASGLDEVVVVGFAQQKKVNLTGSVSIIDAKDIESRSVTTVSQALQGLATGLEIGQSSYGGSLEGAFSQDFNIRGVNTIGQGSSGGPLILIDGAVGTLNHLSPNDIESISILKDAAASSIYGSRAPFGVILVTTKRGSKGKPVVVYNNNFRSTRPMNFPETADSYRWALFINDASNNSGAPDFVGPDRLQRIQDYMAGKPGLTNLPVDPGNPTRWAGGSSEGNDNLDWWKVVFRESAPAQEHTVGVRGGGDHVKYYISGNLLDQTGLLNLGGDALKRYNVTANLDADISHWISFGFNGKFSREDYDRPSHFEDRFMQYMSRIQPANPLYDPNGNLYDVTVDRLSIIKVGGRYNRIIDATSSQFRLTMEPVKGWKIHGRYYYRLSDRFARTVKQTTYAHDVEGNPYVAEPDNFVSDYIERNDYISQDYYTEYGKSVNGHNFHIIAGFQSELNKFRNGSATRVGLIVTDNPTINITTGQTIYGSVVAPSVSGGESDWATAGYFGRLNYNYQERYLFEANFRYDGTSRFRSERRWGKFPSVSAGWNIAKEDFWQPLQRHVNNLKLRVSYGLLGNQNTNSLYPTYVTMPVSMSSGGWLVNGVRPNTASSPGLVSATLTWETIKAWNGGLDLEAFRSRLGVSFDLFVRYTNNMVGPAPELPSILGASVPVTNNTDLKTSGFELELNWNDRLGNGLRYGAKLMISDAVTTILKYPNPTNNIYSYLTGSVMGNIWGYTTIGIAKSAEEMDKHLASLPNGGQSALGSNWSAGDIMYKDLNGDGRIDGGTNTLDDPGDLSVIGNRTPRYRFGLNLSAEWKGLDLRVFFQGVMKRQIFNGGYNFWGAGPNVWWATAYIPHLDYFRDDPNHPLGLNLDSYYPRPYFNGDYWEGDRNKVTQTRYLQDASYIRMKNITLGYTLPFSITNKARISKLRVYVSGENLFTFSRISPLFDPEVLDQGFTGSVYPLSKVYSAGLNLTF